MILVGHDAGAREFPPFSTDACIKCNVCTTVCPVSRVTDAFPGPKYVGPQAQPGMAQAQATEDTAHGKSELLQRTGPLHLGVPAVPAEEFIAPIAGEGDRHLLPGGTAQEVGREDGNVAVRLVVVIIELLQFLEIPGVHHRFVVRRAEHAGGFPRRLQFIPVPSLEPDRKRVAMGRFLGREIGDRSGVNPATEKHADRHIRQQSAAQRQQLKPLTNKLKSLESQMEKLQRRLSEIEAQLSDVSIYEDVNKARLQALLAEQTSLQPQLMECEENWLLVSEEIEAAS